MQRINSTNRAANKFGAGKDGFQGGSPATGVKATYVTPEWANAVQEEIACGMLQQAQDGSGWAVNLTTNGSQVACVQTHYELPGYTETTEGIHSHPASHSVRLSRQDARLGRGMCGSHLRVSPFSFSGPDYAAGPGWLVTPAEPLRSAKLLYQSGKGTETTVTTLDLSVAVRPDRGTLPGWKVVQTGVSLVASPMVREDVQWGRRTCKAF